MRSFRDRLRCDRCWRRGRSRHGGKCRLVIRNGGRGARSWKLRRLYAQRGFQQLLLLVDEGLIGSLGLGLIFEVLAVELGGLFLEPLESEKILLCDAQSFIERGLTGWTRTCLRGRALFRLGGHWLFNWTGGDEWGARCLC